MEKVLPPIYQHPFVDVFDKFKLFEEKQITKEGDVTQTIDKELGKKIYKIQGTTSASNYISTPCKSAKYKSLGLTGKYNYLIIKTQVGKMFSTHLDYIVNESNLCRVSISNIFKETKVTGSSVQVPILDVEPQKWTIVQINIFSILEENNFFSKKLEEKKFYLRSFQVCSNQFFRGLMTSDIEYNVTNFPKELSLKCKGNEDWYKLYSWVSIGKMEDQTVDPDLKPTKSKAKIPTKSLLKTKDRKQKENNDKAAKTTKRVAFSLGRDEVTRDLPFGDKENDSFADNQKEETKSITQIHKDEEEKDSKAIQIELCRVRDNSNLIERTRKEIDEIKKQFDIELIGQKPAGDFEVTNNEKLLIRQQPDPKGSDNPENEFLLRPDPIMRLNQCIGMHPKFNSQSILFNKNPKFGSDVIYGSANMVISINTKTMKQKFLFDHTDHVCKIAMTTEFIISAAKPGDSKSNKSKKKKYNKLVEELEIQIIVWDVHTGTNLVSFKPPLEEICDMFVTFRNAFLILAGKDYQGRDLILTYNFPDMVKFSKVDLVTRQLSDFTIYTIKNNPINDTMFVTAGKENIRFWRIKGVITGTNIVLNKIGRGKHFTNILFDYEFYGGDNEDLMPSAKANSK